QAPPEPSPPALHAALPISSYSGDHDNKGAVSGCADEPVAIGQASPQISTTQLPAAGTVGDTFKDKATLAGLFGAHPGGTVSFKLDRKSTRLNSRHVADSSA